MKVKDFRKLVQKAEEGDVDALTTLREEIGNATVFVVRDGELNINSTGATYLYFKKHGFAPEEWGDIPTLTLDQAFAEKVKCDPIRLLPITPGVWTRLWDAHLGHELVAAIYYGIRNGHIRDSGLEIKAKVRAMLDGEPWPLLEEVTKLTIADEEGKEWAMKAVLRRRRLSSTPLVEPVVVPGISPFDQRGQRVGVQVNTDGGLFVGGKVTVVGGDLVGRDKVVGGIDPTTLREFIVDGFSDGEVRTLCMDTGVDHENLGGSGKAALVRELVLWAKRYGKLDVLALLARQRNPAKWARYF